MDPRAISVFLSIEQYLKYRKIYLEKEAIQKKLESLAKERFEDQGPIL
jgi:hypothetical protein